MRLSDFYNSRPVVSGHGFLPQKRAERASLRNGSGNFIAGKITAFLKESISRRTGELNKLLIKTENC